MRVDEFVYKMVLKGATEPQNVMTKACAYILSDRWGKGRPLPWVGEIARQILCENKCSPDLDTQHQVELQ